MKMTERAYRSAVQKVNDRYYVSIQKAGKHYSKVLVGALHELGIGYHAAQRRFNSGTRSAASWYKVVQTTVERDRVGALKKLDRRREL